MSSNVLLLFWFVAYIIMNDNAKFQLQVNECEDVLCNPSNSKRPPAPDSIQQAYLSWMMKYFKGSVALLLAGIAVGHEQYKTHCLHPAWCRRRETPCEQGHRGALKAVCRQGSGSEPFAR